MKIKGLNIFRSKVNIETVTTHEKSAPDIPGILPVLPVEKLLDAHAGHLVNLKELAGLSEPNFDRFYKTSIHNFARLVQLLPASEVHHHASPGGMLAHTLDVCVIALKLRRSYVLSTSNNAEDVSAEQDIWTYSIFLAALCHDLAKPVVDQIIDIYDRDHKSHKWLPWANFLDEQGEWYTCQFVRKRQYQLHEKASPLLIHRIIPPYGMEWLSSNQTIFTQCLASVSGDNENALSIGEIITLADSKSVANNLGAESSQITASATRVKPLHEKMLTALRHLLLEGELPLNRNGAAGWIKGDACWLVSKRTIDAIRDQLTKEGHSGLPSKNGRMYDILQDHAVLSPCGDKAIWKVAINGEDWSNELTVINIPVSKIWINHDSRPDEFEGSVIASEMEGFSGESKENTVTPSIEANDKAIDTPKTSESKNKAETNMLDMSLFLPSSIEEPVNTNDVNLKTIENKDQTVSTEKTGNGIKKQPIIAKEKVTAKEQSIQQELPNIPCHTLFFEWLQDGVSSGKIKTNAAKARVHVVSEGVIVVTPGIFQDFSESTQNQYNWKDVQKIVLKQKLHSRDDKGLNVIKYEVKGQNKMTKINAILFNDKSLVFGNVEPPSQNPHLGRIV
jgi:integrating conjugative element relaxase (TIGR03760 family)